MLLSVIIPVFNEEEIVAETYRVLEEELKDIEHELIFVNDGSKDRTREILEGRIHKDSAITVDAGPGGIEIKQ